MAKRRVVPATTDIAVLAPGVQGAVAAILAGMAQAGFKAIQYDTLRTKDRQAFLYGKGRTAEQLVAVGLDAQWAWPDCPDGRVTNAPTIDSTWHGYGLACDIVENDKTPWIASQAFWNTLGELARANNMTWGGDWKMKDLPHCQWRWCPATPPPSDRILLFKSGMDAVWQRYRA